MATRYVAITITAPTSKATLTSLLVTASSSLTAGYRKLSMQADPANTAAAKIFVGDADLDDSPQRCGKVMQAGDVYPVDVAAGMLDDLNILGSTSGLLLNIEIWA
jgi:hypothetical protein